MWAACHTFPLPPLLWHASSWRAGSRSWTSGKIISAKKNGGGKINVNYFCCSTFLHSLGCLMSTVTSKSSRNTQVEIRVENQWRWLFWWDHHLGLVHAVLLGRERKASPVGKGTSAECWAEFCWLAAVASRGLCSLCTPCWNLIFTVVGKKKISLQMASYRFTSFDRVSRSKSLLLKTFFLVGTLIGYFCLWFNSAIKTVGT